jgi:hypothetical protein
MKYTKRYNKKQRRNTRRKRKALQKEGGTIYYWGKEEEEKHFYNTLASKKARVLELEAYNKANEAKSYLKINIDHNQNTAKSNYALIPGDLIIIRDLSNRLKGTKLQLVTAVDSDNFYYYTLGFAGGQRIFTTASKMINSASKGVSRVANAMPSFKMPSFKMPSFKTPSFLKSKQGGEFQLCDQDTLNKCYSKQFKFSWGASGYEKGFGEKYNYGERHGTSDETGRHRIVILKPDQLESIIQGYKTDINSFIVYCKLLNAVCMVFMNIYEHIHDILKHPQWIESAKELGTDISKLIKENEVITKRWAIDVWQDNIDLAYLKILMDYDNNLKQKQEQEQQKQQQEQLSVTGKNSISENANSNGAVQNKPNASDQSSAAASQNNSPIERYKELNVGTVFIMKRIKGCESNKSGCNDIGKITKMKGDAIDYDLYDEKDYTCKGTNTVLFKKDNQGYCFGHSKESKDNFNNDTNIFWFVVPGSEIEGKLKNCVNDKTETLVSLASPASASVVPPSESASVVPTSASTSVVPSSASAAVVPASESVAVVPTSASPSSEILTSERLKALEDELKKLSSNAANSATAASTPEMLKTEHYKVKSVKEATNGTLTIEIETNNPKPTGGSKKIHSQRRHNRRSNKRSNK